MVCSDSVAPLHESPDCGAGVAEAWQNGLDLAAIQQITQSMVG